MNRVEFWAGPVLIGIGANLPGLHGEPPLVTCEAAIAALAGRGVLAVRRSRWFWSRPVPPSDQPPYVNGVIAVATPQAPSSLLACLHEIEAAFGRTRSTANAARVLDLDLLAYGAFVSALDDPVRVPHPRLAERAFVLKPLAEVAPDWVHPVLARSVADLIAALPPDQNAEPVWSAPGPVRRRLGVSET